MMTIQSIETILLDLPYETGGPKPLFAGKPRKRVMLLVRVETDTGIVGWGEAFAYGAAAPPLAAIEQLVVPLAVGREEVDIEGLMTDLQKKVHHLGRSGAVMYALSGLDIALWDIAGKAAQKPLCELLGGMRRTTLPAYASLMRYGDPAIVARNAGAAAARGYTTIKLHETGVEHLRAAREAVGPDIKLAMDVNCSWSLDEAVKMADQFRKYDLYWFEEPLWPPEDYVALASLRQRTGMSIAAGENVSSSLDFSRMFDCRAVDIAQPSVTKIGGVTELVRIARFAEARGVRFVPHSPYFGPGLLATMHVAAAFEPETIIEHYYCELGANPFGDAIAVSQAQFAVPQGPGLGRDPDPEVIKRCRIG
jgi:D-galactarolactone cycloisomerase